MHSFLTPIDVNEDVSPTFSSFPVIRQSPIVPIAQQRPELAASLLNEINYRQMDLIDRLHARQTNLELRRLDVQRYQDMILGTADIVKSHAATIASAVHSRPDRDHFRMTTTGESHKEGFLFSSDRRVFTATTQLDVW